MTLRTERRKGDLTPTHLVITPTAQRTMCGRFRDVTFPHQWLNAAVTEANQGHDIWFCAKCVKAAEARLT